jgi:REP element-mobilizing transposase RayT
MRRKIQRPVQLTLDDARKEEGRGGWRRKAGRPRGRTRVAHEKRETFAARYPQHITVRVVAGVSLRKDWLMRIIHGAIRDSEKETFRIIEFDVLGNHLHFVGEASGADALSRGMNGLEVRLARRLNKAMKRKGELFVDRYHARTLRTPREVLNVLRYVLLNARHHAAQRGMKLDRSWFDPFSSAAWFDGWKSPPRPCAAWSRTTQRPTASARTWLLTTGWRRWGPLALDDVPG